MSSVNIQSPAFIYMYVHHDESVKLNLLNLEVKVMMDKSGYNLVNTIEIKPLGVF